MAELDPRLYTVAWIAPLEIEAQAAICMLDKRHEGRFPLQRGDDYVFQAGDICGHNIIIATLPAGQEYGTGSAAALASQVRKFFPNLWFGLLVGVAAGLPRLTGPSPRDIRLGDVLVALPEGESAGLIAYDLGKETAEDGFQLLRGGHVLAMTETVIRSAIGNIRLHAPDDVKLFSHFYETIKTKRHASGTFADPGQDADRLYETDNSGTTKPKSRERRSDDIRTRVWYGPIGSGDKLMKNAAKRDALRDKYDVIGIEMEAAGTMNRIPVGVIRGVCDYGDEHKNKAWQPYAAAMAASYAKAVLQQIGPRKGYGDEEAQRPTRRVCHVPFRQNKNFTGREHQIKELWRMLFTEERERVAVVGLGGMGKTQTVLELAYRVRLSMKQYSILWMPAQSMPAFEKTATELVQKLGIHCGDGDDPKEALRAYLSSEAAGNWLLILDNADDMEFILGSPGKSTGLFDVLPQSPTGRTLITTRSSQIAVHAGGVELLELTGMTSEEANIFLGMSLVDKTQIRQVGDIAELLEKLAYMPLTMAQAAAYMNMNKMPIIAYLRLCNQTDHDMINLLGAQLRDETHYSKTQGAVATTWIISFNTICQTDTTSARLLSFIRWIESKAIPRSILPETESDWDLTQAIGLLCGYGFLSWREDGQTLDMHSLVHLALRFWPIQRHEGLMTEENAIEHLTEIFPWGEWEDRLLWRQYFPHVLPLAQSDKMEQNTGRDDLGEKIGRCLLKDGRIKEGVEVLQSVAAIREKTLAEDHPSRLASQHVLASAYKSNGQVKEAIALLKHVVAIWEKTLAEDHPNRLASQHELAAAYESNGQVKEAIALLKHVVAIREKTLAEDHPNRLTSQHELARAYKSNGQVKEAITLLKHIVAIQEKTLAEDHPDQLTSQHVLAGAYESNGQVKEAIALLKHMVAIWEKTLAEDHPNRLASQYELAGAYESNGQVKEAIALFEYVVAIEQKVLAEDHPGRLNSQHELARAYKSNGQVKEAIALFEYVVAIKQKVLAEDHPGRLNSQYELARAYKSNGQVKEAIALLKHMVAIWEKTLAEDHPNRLASQYELAGAYESNGQVKEAIALFEYVVAIEQKVLAEDHPSRLNSQHELASVYESNGQVKEAIALLKHVVAIREKTLAEGHPDRLISQRSLARAYEANGQVEWKSKHRFRWWKNIRQNLRRDKSRTANIW
ncbi:hypothetical protein N7490_002269 [Penicillium lividum]|nr:hypothetical protein N7490_002269 [Penicillium lividum]